MDSFSIKSDLLFGRPKLVQWIVIPLFITVFISAVFSFFTTIKLCIELTLSSKYCAIISYHDLITSLRSLLVIFGFKWSYLVKHITLFSNVHLDMDQESVRFIDRRKKIRSILFFICFISYWFISIRISFLRKPDYPVMRCFYLIFGTLDIVSWLCLLFIIIELCINLQALFNLFNRQIVHLHKMSLFHPRVSSSLKYELKIYRYHYSLGIHMMKAADQFARVYITWLYTEYAINSISEFFAALTFQLDFFVRAIFNITNGIITCYLTFNLINVNTQSNNILEELYEISFHSCDLTFRQEIDFCLYRLSKRNVGFTYGNIFVITPNFITSLATITLTIVLAIPNLMKFGG